MAEMDPSLNKESTDEQDEPETRYSVRRVVTNAIAAVVVKLILGTNISWKLVLYSICFFAVWEQLSVWYYRWTERKPSKSG